MSERSALSALRRSEPPNIESMRAAADAALAPSVYLPQAELEQARLRLRTHLQQLTPLVEEMARTRPVESVAREVALAESASARTLLSISLQPALRCLVQNVRGLARAVRALCDQHDMLTGARPLGATS